MNWRETLRTGLDAVRAHRLRSVLTMVGILIGIAAVILTVGFGEGASAQIRAQISSLGTNLLIITPGSATSAGGVNGPLGSATTLTVQDADALASKAAAPDIEVVAPISQTSQTLTAGTANWTTMVVGTTPGWLKARARAVAEGRFSAASADFTINSQQSLLSTATSVNKTLTVLLAGIAAISLLVGGIGVMNIMLVSVTERIREIGLRKALGATPRVIRRQFLVEASLLGLTGGVLGAAAGLAGAVVLPHLISNAITISPAATVGAIVIAVVIGLVFGVYPASRAARLAPIDALRTE